MAENQYDFPTEVIDLPSKGLLYPKENPLSSGKVEIKYMTAKEEDILTSANLIQQGTVLDKLFESIIPDKSIKIDDMLIGDKNAIMLGARILGYGKEMGNLREVGYDFFKVWNSKRAKEVRKYIQDRKCYCPLANQAYSNILCDPISMVKVVSKLK